MASSSSVLLILLLLVAGASLIPLSAAQMASLDNAVEILSSSGFVSMALTLQLAPQSLLTTTPRNPFLTIFSPPDSAFASSGQPPLDLLSFHLSPSRLPPSFLYSLPPGSRIPTLLPNRSLLVTSSSAYSSSFSLNGVTINASSPIYDDGSTIVYAVASFLDPHDDVDPNLMCSSLGASAAFAGDSFAMAAEALRSHGFSAAAALLDAQLLPASNHTITIFAPPDADVSRAAQGGGFVEYVRKLSLHAVPCRLAWSDLVRLGQGTRLPTFAGGFEATLTSNSGEFVALNGVPVTQPNIYYGESVIAHGLGNAISPAPSAVSFLPTSAPSPRRPKSAKVEDASVQYEFGGDGNNLDYEELSE